MVGAAVTKAKAVDGLWELPTGWEWVRFANILKLEYGKSLPARIRDSSGQIPVFGSGGQVGKHSSFLTSSPAIVIGRKGSIGALFFSKTSCWPIDTTYYIDAFPPHIEPKYVFFFLRTLGLEKMNKAAAIPGLNRDDVHRLTVPIPSVDDPFRSLDVQRRIVARIETLQAEVKKAREILEKMRRDSKQMMNAALEEIFGELERAQVVSQPLGCLLISKPQYGTSQKASDSPQGLPILRMGNIINGRLSFDNLKYLQLSHQEEQKYLLHPGDILFNRTNSAELVGKSAVFEGFDRAVFASYLIRLVPDPVKAKAHYLVAYINSGRGRAYIQSQLTRAIGQVNVNAKKLAAMPIPLPDQKRQEQIISHLNALQAQTGEMQQLLEQDAKLLDQLEQSILDRAFRGDL